MKAGQTPQPGGIPRFLARRVFWLMPLMAWTLAVLASLHVQLGEHREHSLEVATAGARDIFKMIVLTRAWNAGHGGVYVPVTEKTQPNPYLRHPRRDLATVEGTQLTMINPAFMTRQLSELGKAQTGAIFHITSLRPIRPMNGADGWETKALMAFERGAKEIVEIVGTDRITQLRYMAPIKVTPPCMTCHAQQGYKVGDIRGGISVSIPFAPIAASLGTSTRHAYASHGLVYLLVVILGWLLLETLRQRWLELDLHVTTLDKTRARLEESNRSLVAARDAAESASRAKSGFLTTVSHELRTPMNAVLGMADLLNGSTLSQAQRNQLDILRHSGQSLMKLLNEVIDYARIEDGHDEPVLARIFDPRVLLASVAASRASQAQAKGLSLRVDTPPGEVDRLIGDDVRIQRILDHFADNAIKFSQRGEVVLTAMATPVEDGRAWLVLSVRDNGMGVSPEMRERLFKPFEVADSTTTRHHGGIGLGLAICKRIADSLSATLDVQDLPDGGSVFSLTLSLPRAPTGSDTATPEQIDELIQLLAQDDIRASERFASVAPALRAMLGGDFGMLEGRLSRFEYVEALDILRRHVQVHTIANQ